MDWISSSMAILPVFEVKEILFCNLSVEHFHCIYAIINLVKNICRKRECAISFDNYQHRLLKHGCLPATFRNLWKKNVYVNLLCLWNYFWKSDIIYAIFFHAPYKNAYTVLLLLPPPFLYGTDFVGACVYGHGIW